MLDKRKYNCAFTEIFCMKYKNIATKSVFIVCKFLCQFCILFHFSAVETVCNLYFLYLACTFPEVDAWPWRSWLLFDCIPWPSKCKKQKNNLRSSMYTTRDRQGHLWQCVTLTYCTRSRVKVMQLVVIWLHFLTHRMQETKKNHRSSMYTTRNRKGHL